MLQYSTYCSYTVTDAKETSYDWYTSGEVIVEKKSTTKLITNC